jgi:hypothetical protein
VATISSLLADHVSLRVRSVDRLFLQGYVPRLQSEGLVVSAGSVDPPEGLLQTPRLGEDRVALEQSAQPATVARAQPL